MLRGKHLQLAIPVSPVKPLNILYTTDKVTKLPSTKLSNECSRDQELKEKSPNNNKLTNGLGELSIREEKNSHINETTNGRNLGIIIFPDTYMSEDSVSKLREKPICTEEFSATRVHFTSVNSPMSESEDCRNHSIKCARPILKRRLILGKSNSQLLDDEEREHIERLKVNIHEKEKIDNEVTDIQSMSPIRQFGLLKEKEGEFEDMLLSSQMQKREVERQLVKRRSSLHHAKRSSIAISHYKLLINEKVRVKDQKLPAKLKEKGNKIIYTPKMSNSPYISKDKLRVKISLRNEKRMPEENVKRRGICMEGGRNLLEIGMRRSSFRHSRTKSNREFNPYFLPKTLDLRIPSDKHKKHKHNSHRYKTRGRAQDLEEMGESFLEKERVDNLLDNKLSMKNKLFSNRDSYAILSMSRKSSFLNSQFINLHMNQKLFGASTKFHAFKQCSLIYKPTVKLPHFI